MFITPIKISPLAQRRTSVGVSLTQILDIEHEWYMPNVQNADGNIITIPDSGSVGGLNLQNLALTNKPTASTINGLKSYKGDGIDDYIEKKINNFGKSFSGWMIQCVFKYDSSGQNYIFSTASDSSVNAEGVFLLYNTVIGRYQISSYDAYGVAKTYTITQALTNGNNYVVTFGYTGSNLVVYHNEIKTFENAITNPFIRPTNTDNLTLLSIIREISTNGFGVTNIGYANFGTYNEVKLTNNIYTLKALYGIA